MQDHGIDQRIDYRIMEEAKAALEDKTPVSLKMDISNLDRTTGTILSYNISTKSVRSFSRLLFHFYFYFPAEVGGGGTGDGQQYFSIDLLQY